MQKITPEQLTQNPFSLIGKQWTLITANAGDRVNAMTASWGGLGILWNKPVAFLFVRPQRFTQELLTKSDSFSLCFLPESQRAALNYCGSHSGRDEDKLAACGLTAEELDGVPVIAGSELVLTCRKLFCQRFTPESFVDTSLITQNYSNEDFHYLYIAEISGAYLA